MKNTDGLFKYQLTAAYASSLVISCIIVLISAVSLVLGPDFYGLDLKTAAGVTTSTAGILLSGFFAHDLFNLVVGVPILIGSLWLARRGSLLALLLWPGVLFYTLYTYTTYVIGSPFTVLFIAHLAVVALSAYSTIGLVASIDGEQIRQRLTGVVPARALGAILVALALLTVGQDAAGAVATALESGTQVAPLARHIWTADLLLEVPALLMGGVLLWRRKPLGFVVGAGLLFQFGVTPIALAVMLSLQPILTSAPVDTATITGLLVFALVSFAPLTFFLRSRVPQPRIAEPRHISA